MNNNNLIVFLNDGTKIVLTFPIETSEQKALKDFEAMRPEAKGQVKKYFFIEDDSVSPEVYKNHYKLDSENKLTMNMRNAFAEKAVEEIRKRRDFFISNLDVPFFRALEEDDGLLKQHITKLKNFLRDLPNNLRLDEIEEDEDVLLYNPFGNIFNLDIVEQGEGYTTPPKVIIDEPKGSYYGFQAKAVAFIEDGKVVRVEMTDFGCGYDFAPNVSIEAPENGKPAVIANGWPQNVVLSDKDILSNTESIYS
tara:strand:+ start:2548 stop:3300 length:753 start_codon:yes stop_codon:yes gene_type:complete